MAQIPFPAAEDHRRALQDGSLVDVTAQARLCGLAEPVAFTRALYELCQRSAGLDVAGVDAVLGEVKESHERPEQDAYDLMFAVVIDHQRVELLAVFEIHQGIVVGLFDEASWTEDWRERYGIATLP